MFRLTAVMPVSPGKKRIFTSATVSIGTTLLYTMQRRVSEIYDTLCKI